MYDYKICTVHIVIDDYELKKSKQDFLFYIFEMNQNQNMIEGLVTFSICCASYESRRGNPSCIPETWLMPKTNQLWSSQHEILYDSF